MSAPRPWIEAGTAVGRFTPAELHAIRDRVLAEIAANPPTGPLLGESPRVETCRAGHPLVPRSGGRRYCPPCRNARRREREGRE